MSHSSPTFDLQALKRVDLSGYGDDFLLTWEKPLDAIKAIVYLAEILEEFHRRQISFRYYDSGLAISIIRDKSTRTRYSFAAAANALGLTVEALDEEKSQVSHGETVRETAVMLSFLTEVIGIRDDMYLGEGNRYMREVAAAVDEALKENVLHRRPSLVNLQCDLDHPTQSLADLLALKQHFGSLEALRGRKLTMSWAYSPSYGKPLSVPQGIIALMPRLGMDVTLAYPKGYDLLPEVVQTAERQAAENGGSLHIVHDMKEAFAGADVGYPKSWAPMNVMKHRTTLLHKRDTEGLKALEKECLVRNAEYTSWECGEEIMKLTKDGNALYMHCLPADISGVSCKQGEVSASVFEKYRAATYREAGHKPFVIAAMIWLSRVPNPIAAIEQLLNR
ncbi:knotted carbamoyltransferase YgeW [bacterium]|nr:knotted carbamoyltransferase YgeW [bacterium]MBU1984799.1 knotted carbamoyltransferase YgeW [bacterium]